MKAKLVLVSFMIRVIVEDNATEEEILHAAKDLTAVRVRDEFGENIEEIIDDLESPYEAESDLIGYQIESADGLHEIPHRLHSSEVLTEADADRWLLENNEKTVGKYGNLKWKKVPVFYNTIEDPLFIYPYSEDVESIGMNEAN